jgi:uncharacterized membrane protein
MKHRNFDGWETNVEQHDGRILSPRRAAISLGFGAVAGVLPVLLGAPSLSLLTGWIAAASLALLWVWRISWPQDADGTRRLAEAESRSHSTDLPVLVACATSFCGVVLALIQSDNTQNNPVGVILTVLSVIASLLAWALVNTVFTFKYARHYYVSEDGGIDFKQQEPSYSDFAYLAFTVGMSYAVSDTGPVTTATRKMALGHALLSYGFGTLTIAVAINLVTNLGQA